MGSTVMDTEKDHHHYHVNHHYNHHNNYQTSTTTTTTTTTTTLPVLKTPVLEDSDKVDGVLFSTDSLHNEVQATPEPGSGTLPHQHHTRSSSGVGPIRVYLTRFWILATFSFLSYLQCLMWNTWGPISASMDAAYPGWGSGTVAMMGNWGSIMFIVAVVPVCWFVNTKGLRAGVLLCGGMMAAGTVLRALSLLLSTNTTLFTVTCHICAILVGISGTLMMAAPPMIGAVWFPPNERTTATAFSQLMNVLGNSGSYLEPLMVREPSSSNPDAEEVEEIQHDIKRLMYIWAGVTVVLMVVLVVYFPAKPPSPPSLTSHVERLDFKESAKMMFRKKDLLLLVVPYGVCVGVPSTWISVLNFSLYDLGLSQDDAMWVGMSAVLGSAVTTLLAARLTDLIYGYIKLSLILICSITIFFFYWFFVLSWQDAPVPTWQIYVTVTCGTAFSTAMCPLFYELSVESAYPCSEVMVGGLLGAFDFLMSLCFLFLFLVPFPDYQWVTYVLLFGTAGSLIPLSFAREDYSRSTIDRSQPHSPYQHI